MSAGFRVDFNSERDLADFAGRVARRWQASKCYPLVVALEGDLGTGKTTWVRAMLRGLGYDGRVPSPTYTLLEHYALMPVSVVHLDLYRLGGEEDLENLGVRDWLAQPDVWLLVEWPSRAERLHRRRDLSIELEFSGPTSRVVTFSAATESGRKTLEAIADLVSSNGP